MKNKFSFLLLAVMLFAANFINAQAPNSFNYQAVLRNSSGNLITSGLVEMRFTIRNGSASGTVQFQETKTVNPNQFGLVNHAVGTGSIVSGSIAGVTWESGSKFLQVEANTGSGFVDLGTQQMVSVPFALEAQHATTANLATNATNAANATNATNATNSTTTSQIRFFTTNVVMEQINGNNTGYGTITHNLNISQSNWAAIATYRAGGLEGSCYADASTQWLNPNTCRVYIQGTQCPGAKAIRLTIFTP